MASFLSFLSSLGFSFESLFLFIILILFYIKLDHKIDLVFKLLSKDIGHIKEILSNHMTDTNKKIDQLDNKFDKRIDKLESKIEQNFRK